MNRPSKLLQLIALIGSVGLVLAPSMVAAAQESPFCKNLSTTSSTVTNKMTDLKNKLDQARSKEDQDRQADRAKWDQEIQANRAKWDQDRQDNFKKLEAKATTDAEKAAVTTYEQTVLNAVNTRRGAYDAARAAFRKGVEDAIASRRAAVDGQVDTFTSSVNSAIGTAQSSCSANPSNGPAIRETFVSALKNARTTFQGERKDDTKIGDTVKQLVATRQAAFKAADATFQQTITAARNTLKSAFGNDQSKI